jgi:hypothetical protein
VSKYPLDSQGIEEIVRDFLLHDRAQNEEKEKLYALLEEVLPCIEDDELHEDVEKIVKARQKRKADFDNHRFNQQNGHFVGERSPYPLEAHENTSIPAVDEGRLNAVENEGGEMSEDELAKHFQEKPVKRKKKKVKKLSKMSLEEIESWERAQDNSNDIYKLNARIKNAARMAVKGNLTAQGDMLTNTFTHLLKALYDFADTVPDKETRIRLTELVKKQENVPADLISALTAGIRAPS